jgi:hypothetical protein
MPDTYEFAIHSREIEGDLFVDTTARNFVQVIAS